MSNKYRTVCKYLVWSLITIAFSITTFTTPAMSNQAGSIWSGKSRAYSSRLPKSISQSVTKQRKAQEPDEKQAAVGNQKPGKGRTASPREDKKQQGIAIIEDVLLTTDKITPAEYRIFTEVEAATLLWNIDRERSITILRGAVKAMRQLLESAKVSTVITPFRKSKERRLWFLAMRKIAALKPELVQELVLENSSEDQSKRMPPSDDTEEARALLSLASEQIQKDPKLAARLALMSIPLGQGAWPTFLVRLGKRDPGEAERVAWAFILQLRDSSASPLALRNLFRFVLDPARSSALRNHFFQSLAIRLRRDIRPDASMMELEHGLDVAQEMSIRTSAGFPHWQDEFRSILIAYELLFKERALPDPAISRTGVIGAGPSVATPEDTLEISDAAAEVEKMARPKLRDEEYKRLAIQAGEKADSHLVDRLISKIEDPEIRRSATVRAYSPIVRKAIRESSWSEAQKQASKIEDPLGRTLVIHRIARDMQRAKEDKYSVLYAYSTAMSLLEREPPSEQVAKGFLVLADALNSLDPQASVDALKSMSLMLNKVVDREEPLGSSLEDPALATWTPVPDVTINHNDVLHLADMLASTFKKVANRDIDTAMSAAYGIHHMGLYSLAQLAIGSALLDQAKGSPGKPRQPKKATM